MILEIKSWCEGIIVAIILCIIIESLIPEGNNKKYIKVVIGIYIMYVSLNPILNLLNYDFNFEFFEEYAETEATSVLPDNNIKDIYVLGIEQNIRNEIEEMGYKIENVKVFVDLNYENIEKVELILNRDRLKNQNQISQQIIADNEENSTKNYNDIFDYISKNYQVDLENIIIK